MYPYDYEENCKIDQLELNFYRDSQCGTHNANSFRANNFEDALNLVIRGEDFAFFPINSLHSELETIFDLKIYTGQGSSFEREEKNDSKYFKKILNNKYDNITSSLIYTSLHKALDKAYDEFSKHGIDKKISARWISNPSTVTNWHADFHLISEVKYRVIMPFTPPGTIFCETTTEEKIPFLKTFMDNSTKRMEIEKKCNEQEKTSNYQLAPYEGAIYKNGTIHRGPVAKNRSFAIFFIHQTS